MCRHDLLGNGHTVNSDSGNMLERENNVMIYSPIFHIQRNAHYHTVAGLAGNERFPVVSVEVDYEEFVHFGQGIVQLPCSRVDDHCYDSPRSCNDSFGARMNWLTRNRRPFLRGSSSH